MDFNLLNTYSIDKYRDEFSYSVKNIYPFSQMTVGDSFLIDDFKKAESARVSAAYFSKCSKKGFKFSLKKMNDGWRLFRIQ